MSRTSARVSLMNELLPLRVVARRAGLSADVLRAWERRYKAVVPVRTDTGRRMYSSGDVERLILLRRLTLAGHSIGRIAAYPSEKLRAMASEDSRLRVSSEESSNGQVDLADPVGIDACLDAIRACDQTALNELIARASLNHTPSSLVEKFLSPLMTQVGELWHEGKLRIAAEHLATSTIRSFVGGLLQSLAPGTNAPIVIVATPAGQQHEMGALFAAATAAQAGWSVLYLGANLPAEEIAAAARTSKARAVALSVVFPADDPLLPAQLRKLRTLLPTRFPICIGGQASGGYANVEQEAELRVLADFAALRGWLAELRRDTQG